MKKLISPLTVILILTAATVFAEMVKNSGNLNDVQGAAPDPSLTILISDNLSHNVSLSGMLWYDLVYQGSSTCYVRLMKDTTKASWIQESVQTMTNHSYVVYSKQRSPSVNVLWLNYSGCYGSATANSVIHRMPN